MPSSSQPTGWAGRRAATTAPTVTELTTARTGMATSGKMNWTRSGRPARRRSWSSQGTAARQSRLASHSAHASPAVHRRGRPGPAVDVIAVVLTARSAPPIRPPPTLVRCQCGRLASGQRYEGRTGPRHQAVVKQALKCQVSSATTTSRQLDQRYDERDAKHASVPLPRVRTGELRWEKFLYELKAGPAGGRLRRPSSRRQRPDGHRGTGLTLHSRWYEPRPPQEEDPPGLT